VRYKPYWVMSDAAAVSAFAYAWAFSKRFPSVSGFGLGLAILAALLIYKIVLEAKAALGKGAARSFLQDCLLVIIPCFLVVSLLIKQPLSLALAFLGTLLPLYGCLARVGCFLGGCCYGKPSNNGVLYPRSIFESTGHGCRRYSASPDRAPVCFRYNSSKRLRKQRSLGYSPSWSGNFRARPRPSFGYISQRMRSFGSSSTFIGPPARDRDIGTFPKRS
jgi:hypothetical protein